MSSNGGGIHGKTAVPVLQMLALTSRVLHEDHIPVAVVDVLKNLDSLFYLRLTEIKLSLLERMAVQPSIVAVNG